MQKYESRLTDAYGLQKLCKRYYVAKTAEVDARKYSDTASNTMQLCLVAKCAMSSVPSRPRRQLTLLPSQLRAREAFQNLRRVWREVKEISTYVIHQIENYEFHEASMQVCPRLYSKTDIKKDIVHVRMCGVKDVISTGVLKQKFCEQINTMNYCLWNEIALGYLKFVRDAALPLTAYKP